MPASHISRRALLRAAGAGAAIGLRPAIGAAEPVSPVMARLASYMAAAGGTALPDAVVEQARLH